MIKTSAKYLFTLFLILSILLLSVYSQLYAYSTQEYAHSSTGSSLRETTDISLHTLQNEQDLTPKYTSTNPEKGFKVEATDIEEESLASLALKKLLERDKLFAAVLYTFILAFFFRHIKAGLLFCKHFSYSFSQRRYLLLQEFRI